MNSGLCLRVLILVALTVPIRAAQPAPVTFTLTVSDGPTSTLSGSSVSLLCEVSPLFNAEPLEVRWYRSSNFHSPALLYKDHKIQEAPVDPQYRGRVSLTGGLERGNVSLRLERVTQEDRGEYICQVTSDQWYEKASVFLTVNVTGSEPVLSVAEGRGGGGQVNITCSSVGWSPQPKLTWRNKDGTEIRNGQEVLNTSDPQGLVSVSSWLLYAPSYSNWLSCTVSLSEEAKREGRILPHIYTAPTAVPGVFKEAFTVTLVLLVLFLVIGALCSVILYKRRGSMWSSSQKSRNSSETKNLIEGAENTVPKPTEQMVTGKEVNLADKTEPNERPAEGVMQTDTEKATQTECVLKESATQTDMESVPKAWGEVKRLKVDITLEPKPSDPDLHVSLDRKEIRCKKSKVADVSTAPYVISEDKFNCGQIYWELMVRDEYKVKKIKQSWYVGVATDTAVNKTVVVPLTPENGFWVVTYEKGKGYYVPDDPQMPVSGNESPFIFLNLPESGKAILTTLGVFLDCDRQMLSFYDAESKAHLYSFFNVVSSSTFLAVFSPGLRDTYPLTIK